jgi:hypothetical protein
MTEALYIKLLRMFGPTRLERLLLELDEGNTYVLAKSYGLSKVEISRIRMRATPLLSYHIREGKKQQLPLIYQKVA